MHELTRLKAPARSTHEKKRVGRGQASGQGKTAGRGGKGQKARSGNMNFGGFEGGQMPLQRRLPKVGFKNFFRVEYAVVNVSDLASFSDGSTVDADALSAAGLLKDRKDGLKILGEGELKAKLVVKANAFSESAKAKITAAGGTVEELLVRRVPVEEKKNASKAKHKAYYAEREKKVAASKLKFAKK